MVLESGQWYWVLSEKFREVEIVYNKAEQDLRKRKTRASPVFEAKSIPQ